MNPVSISLLSTIFTTAGALVGIPSIAFLLFYVVCQATKLTAGADASTSFGSNPDAVLLTLKWMSAAIGAIGSFVGAAAQLLLNVLAVVSLAGLALGIMCWLTGHGLRADASWARVSACVILVPLMLVSLLLALSFQSLSRLPLLAMTGFCCLALHTVWTGHVTPAG
jgi:hypothetical protein